MLRCVAGSLGAAPACMSRQPASRRVRALGRHGGPIPAFPYPDEDVGTEEAPRVGDGVVVVDADGRVEFASPNAMNAFHGWVSTPHPKAGASGTSGDETAVEWALANGRPVVEEVERRPDVVVLLHCIPLLSHGVVTGAAMSSCVTSPTCAAWTGSSCPKMPRFERCTIGSRTICRPSRRY